MAQWRGTYCPRRKAVEHKLNMIDLLFVCYDIKHQIDALPDEFRHSQLVDNFLTDLKMSERIKTIIMNIESMIQEKGEENGTDLDTETTRGAITPHADLVAEKKGATKPRKGH